MFFKNMKQMKNSNSFYFINFTLPQLVKTTILIFLAVYLVTCFLYFFLYLFTFLLKVQTYLIINGLDLDDTKNFTVDMLNTMSNINDWPNAAGRTTQYDHSKGCFFNSADYHGASDYFPNPSCAIAQLEHFKEVAQDSHELLPYNPQLLYKPNSQHYSEQLTHIIQHGRQSVVDAEDSLYTSNVNEVERAQMAKDFNTLIK
jgi:hypothetical protein